MSHYFARVSTGLEAIALAEIQEKGGVGEGLEKRTVKFHFEGNPVDLTKLRAVDDVFVFVGEFSHINRLRDSLERLQSGIPALPFDQALPIIRMIRTIPQKPGFTITASLTGKRNYSRYEVAERISKPLEKAINGQYVEQAKGLPLQDLDIRLLLEGETALAGIRLAKAPLHRRSYKQHNRPGSLKPSVAYAMCRCAGIEPHHMVLDAMCGAGTIPIEAALSFPCKQIHSTDIDPEAIGSALKNQGLAGTYVAFQQGDARKLPFEAQSIDRIITNLPWGRQIQADESLKTFYQSVVDEFIRVITPIGKMILLTDQHDILEEIIERSAYLSIGEKVHISLYGSHPTIYSIHTSTPS